jgi:hypothetical protein
MKALPLSLLLLVSLSSASAQSADAIYQQACGPKNASFHVQHVEGKPPAEPEPGKALVYFLQKQSGINFMTRIGLDGAWAGVVQGDSYIYASVEPGEHHACAATMGRKQPLVELVHFAAEAGKVYYYLVRGTAVDAKYGTFFSMPITPVDRDEALYLIASNPTTTATPKP